MYIEHNTKMKLLCKVLLDDDELFRVKTRLFIHSYHHHTPNAYGYTKYIDIVYINKNVKYVYLLAGILTLNYRVH